MFDTNMAAVTHHYEKRVSHRKLSNFTRTLISIFPVSHSNHQPPPLFLSPTSQLNSCFSLVINGVQSVGRAADHIL